MRDHIDGADRLDRRDYLAAVAGASAVGLAGCMGGADAKGTLATQVTDQPGDISDFESCVVSIAGIWVKPSGDDGTPADDEDGGTPAAGEEGDTPADGEGGTPADGETADVDQGEGRTYHEFDEPAEADLVDLQDGNTKLVDDREVPTGEYEFLQLDVTGVEGTLADGGSAEVDTPGNAPLQFKEAFEVKEGQRTIFVADFTPVRRGKTGSYLLKPVASGTEVRYEDTSEE